MANWWESAPLANSAGSSNWWEAAPLQQQGNGGVTRTPQEWADAENLPVPGTEWNTPEPTPRFESPIPGMDFFGELMMSGAENVPVLGPLVDRAADATGTAIATNLLGADPAQVASDAQSIRAAEMREQPLANFAGTVGGAVGPLARVAQTPEGGRMLGTQGTMGQRVAAGGVSGALIAAADAAARGESTNPEIAGQAGIGALLGAGFPLAERAISPVARWLMGQPSPSPAVRSVANTLEGSNINPADLPRLLDDLGPDAMPLDLSRNTQRQAGGIASVQGQGSTTLDDALRARNEGTNARIQGDVDTILGEAPIPSRLAAEIADNRSGLSPMYKDALREAEAVDTRSIARSLDEMITSERGAAQSQLQSLRRDLNEVGSDTLATDPRTLLNIRHKIDGILYTDGQMAPLDSNVSRVLRDARRLVDTELAAKVPGIKDIDRQFAELADQRGAVETGQSVLSSGRNEVIRPAELVDMITGGRSEIVGPSGVPFRLSQGARAEIDRIIGTSGNDVTALKQALKGDGSWNREKLNTLFGQERADQLVDLLEREQRYAGSYQRITQNSETAARTAAQREAMPTQVDLDIQKLLFAIPEALANAGARSRSQAVNAQIAELLTNRPTPEVIDQLIAARRANRGVLGAAGVPVFTGNE
jgi:hypothetical protein